MTTERLTWLKDCLICNEGLCSQMKEIIEKQGITENSAATVLADMVKRQLGYPAYNPKQLLDRFRYHTNKDKKKKVSEFPKLKEAATPKAKAPRVSTKRELLRPKPSSNNFQDLRDSAQLLIEGLRSWAGGILTPKSEQEKKAAEDVKKAAGDIISEYSKLGVDVRKYVNSLPKIEEEE